MAEIIHVRHRKRHFPARIGKLLSYLDDPAQQADNKNKGRQFLPFTFFCTLKSFFDNVTKENAVKAFTPTDEIYEANDSI